MFDKETGKILVKNVSEKWSGSLFYVFFFVFVNFFWVFVVFVIVHFVFVVVLFF